MSPHTNAIAVFHAQTATGKLNAVMTPTTPSGCQVSINRWPGRSEAMVLPYSCRERPTANSQMSIISCTSPRASEVILPASIVTSVREIGLVLDEQLAQPGHQGAPDGCRGGAPRRKRLRGFGYRGVGLFWSGLGDGEQHLTGDGGAGLQAVTARLAELDAGADGGQRVTGLTRRASAVGSWDV